jgi:hypothetical protein
VLYKSIAPIIDTEGLSYSDFGKFGSRLIQEKYTLGGNLKQVNDLISVIPTDGAKMLLTNGGKKVRFITPKLAGRQEIVRDFDTDFEKNLKLQEEYIGLTEAEQK